MTIFSLLIISFLINAINSSYNPIPIGSVIISTTRSISILEPKEYDGKDQTTIIFSARKNMTIINTIFDSTLRHLYVLYMNSTDNQIFLRRLVSLEELSPILYQLPISFNILEINQLASFSSDIENRRAFFINQTGFVTMFSMSGTMKSSISFPKLISEPVRSVAFNSKLNRLFVITDSTVSSCSNLDRNHLQCCQAGPKADQLRSIIFDPSTIQTYAYVIDEISGLYQVELNPKTGCPTILRPMDTMESYRNRYLAVDKHFYVCTGSTDQLNHNSVLILINGVQTKRTIPFDASIVAVHISYLNPKVTLEQEEICFHGITYYDYRIATILAAIFGTIMGIFMCFNALFCIDFFMTKKIIRNLKSQIPHDLLEDRWRRLVEEKYAKLALEIHRKKDDPQPKRKSIVIAVARKVLANDHVQILNDDSRPKFAEYFRRKSESYLNRHENDNHRKTTTTTMNTATTTCPTIHQEENPHHSDLLKSKGEFFC